MSHYTMGRKRAACDLYRFLVDPTTQPHMKSKDATKLATVASGGASRAEVFRWLKLDLSIAAVSQKEERRGAPALLSDDQEAFLVGFALAIRSILEPVTLTTLQQFCKSHLSLTPSLPTLSRTMTCHGFSSQKAMTRSSRLVTESVVDDALSCIEEIRSYEFPPDQVLFMDETGLWSNVRQRSTYHFRNWYENVFLPLTSIF